MPNLRYRLCPNGYHVHPGQSCGCGCGSLFGDLLIFDGIADNNMGDVFIGEMLGGNLLADLVVTEVLDDVFDGDNQNQGYDQDDNDNDQDDGDVSNW
jgi:hypothetical protein